MRADAGWYGSYSAVTATETEQRFTNPLSLGPAEQSSTASMGPIHRQSLVDPATSRESARGFSRHHPRRHLPRERSTLSSAAAHILFRVRGEHGLNHAVARCIDEPLSHADGCGPQEKRELVLADRGEFVEDCLGPLTERDVTRAVALPILALGGALFMAARFELVLGRVAGLAPIVDQVSGGIETSRDRLLSLAHRDRCSVPRPSCHSTRRALPCPWTCFSIIHTSCCRGDGGLLGGTTPTPPTSLGRRYRPLREGRPRPARCTCRRHSGEQQVRRRKSVELSSLPLGKTLRTSGLPHPTRAQTGPS